MMNIELSLARPKLQDRSGKSERRCAQLGLGRPGAAKIVFILCINLISVCNLSSADESKQQVRRLDCEPGEQRHFNYESSTSLWGAASQELRLRASLRLRCMEAPTSSTLKYLAEVLSLEPVLGSREEEFATKGRSFSRFNKLTESEVHLGAGLDGRQVARAEPVFEEVAEAATRVKRSVSGWFSKTWSSVRDFFTNIFQSSERTSVGRDEAFQEHGIDIAGQCKAGKAEGKRGNGLPLDESVFDDLEPKYYIGASSVDALATGYDFFAALDGDHDDQDDQEEQLSFFDDPKPRGTRGKRASTADAGGKQLDQVQLLRMPFVIVQSRLGRIVEVRFSLEEKDVSVKNFKRHLSDLFATNLDQSKSQLNEVTPIGQHPTSYLLDASPNSTMIKQSLLAGQQRQHDVQANEGQQQVAANNELLVKALAAQATALTSTQMADFTDLDTADRKVESRAPPGSQDNQQVSVLRTINSTSRLQLSTRLAGSDIEQMQVQVKQVQQIAEGRLTGNAGQLSMSLVQGGQRSGSNRPKRAAEEPLGDMADLLHVSTSFSIQLVPLSKLGKFASSPESAGKRQRRSREAPTAGNQTRTPDRMGANRRETLVERPKDSQDRERSLESWRQLESKLQFVTSDLLVEKAGPNEGQLERLDVLRNQVQLRLNEEFLRNKLRRLRRQSQRLAVLAPPDSQRRSAEGAPEPAKGGKLAEPANRAPSGANELGLGLTQLVLDSGATGRRKGSIYPTLEEAVELEQSLGVAQSDEAVSRLLRETVRLDRLRAHCKSALAGQSEALLEVELREPFGLPVGSRGDLLAGHKASERRLAQCKQVVGLLVRVGDRRAADLLLELMDECNARLVAAARHEELGFGPAGRHYRRLRQQFTELLAELARPSELLLDRLLGRLHYFGERPASGRPNGEQPEFSLVATGYNRSLLRAEDDFNNNDAAGALLLTIGRLASQPSVSERKRAELAAKLLALLKRTTCSPFDGPDLDILESVASLRLELEQPALAKQLVGLARRCRQHDQYLVACVHALQSQLASSELSQRLLADLLRARNVSCTVKSEIVLSLLGVASLADLSGSGAAGWPAVGVNQVDEALLELTRGESSDRRCLGQLAEHYLAKKRSLEPLKSAARSAVPRPSGARRASRARRASELDFWDEAGCKRWAFEQPPTNGSAATPTDPLDELDDNSLLPAPAGRKQRQHLKLAELAEQEANATDTATPASQVRRRHKCTASKTYGPRNAQATLRAEVVNDLVGGKDENKFLARFRLATNFLGHQIDVGRMYLWHQRQVTRAHVNILGKSLWDTSHSCQDKAPRQTLYMPLFDFSLWLLKVQVGLRLHSEMGFFSNCNQQLAAGQAQVQVRSERLQERPAGQDQLELFPTVQLRAAAEASAKLVVARAGMSLASHYGYQGNIKVSRQPESCMSIRSAHQPMNVTFSSWFQLWDNDCHYWGSRQPSQPQATKWRLAAAEPTVWLKDQCLQPRSQPANSSSLA